MNASIQNLPGYRGDAPVMSEREAATRPAGSGLAYSKHSCSVCGAPYLRAHGIRGRKRSSCSTECKNLPGTLRAASKLLEKIATHQGTTDHAMAALRSDVWGLVNDRAFAGAVYRNATAIKEAQAAILSALAVEPLAATAILDLDALASFPRPVRRSALEKLVTTKQIKSFRSLGIRAYRLA